MTEVKRGKLHAEPHGVLTTVIRDDRDAVYAYCYSPEKAAHIVKCVNMHDALVRQNEIMKEALEVVADYDYGSTAGLAFTAKEALKKAGAL